MPPENQVITDDWFAVMIMEGLTSGLVHGCGLIYWSVGHVPGVNLRAINKVACLKRFNCDTRSTATHPVPVAYMRVSFIFEHCHIDSCDGVYPFPFPHSFNGKTATKALSWNCSNPDWFRPQHAGISQPHKLSNQRNTFLRGFAIAMKSLR